MNEEIAPKPESSCPAPELWARLAAGLCGEEMGDSLLRHAAECAACSDRMRDILAGVAEPSAAPDKRLWMLAIAASVVAMLGFGYWQFGKRASDEPPMELLASAYTQRRTMELKIPGAAYGPMQVERSAAGLGDVPAPLLESQLRIKRHLEGKPDDPAWLHAQGRAQLLVWQFDAAIRTFQIAADLGANSPDFLLDFASAYFQRAEQNRAAIDYANALEKLGQALRQRPEDAAALFNRAIVSGKLHQYDTAIADLEACIRIERDAGWKEEAGKRLAEFRKRRAKLLDPALRATGELAAELDLESAMVEGLGDYFGGRPSGVGKAAAAMVERHRDPWLREVLELPKSPGVGRAVATLRRMAKLRTVVGSDYQDLEAEIGWMRGAPLPLPLRVWRDYELLYRDTRTAAVNHCGDTGALIGASRRYPWFEANVLLESSLCKAGVLDFTGAVALIDEAERAARRDGLKASLIRVPNFRAHRLNETGYFREAIQTASEALAIAETAEYPLRRIYDFHASIVEAAVNREGLSEAGFGAATMTASVGERSGIGIFQMIGLCRRAGFGLKMGRIAEAEESHRSAEALMASFNQSKALKIYWRSSEVAWLEQHKDRDGMYRMLDEAKREGSEARNLYLNRRLIAGLCRTEAESGRRKAVEAMAEQFWKDALQSKRAGSSAIRVQLESISQSLALVRLKEGETDGALDALLRFGRLDAALQGGAQGPDSTPARIEHGSGIVTIVPLGDKLAIWFRTTSGTKFHWSAEGRQEVTRRVRRLRRLCSAGSAPVDSIAREADGMFQLIFPFGILGKSRIYLHAPGELNALPLSALLLVERARDVTFSFAPLGGVPTGIGGLVPNLTVVAGTAFDPKFGLPALPSITGEVEGIRRSFPNAQVLEHGHATSAALELAAKASGVLHFAGHALPWRSGVGLVVAPDASESQADGKAGIWTMGRPRTFKRDLVVFSACGTGVFEDQATVQPGQLTNAALLAGAKRAVATLWDVDSAAAAEWITGFYAQVGAGQAVASAARLASRRVQSMETWRHPRYWAAFAVYEN